MAKSFYLVRSKWWMRMLWPDFTWKIHTREKILFLTFDDGPDPEATPFVLDELKKYDARASFFCIGEHVRQQPALYDRILREGHAVGNHTQHHLNGWKTRAGLYLDDIAEAATLIHSTLFRPPYGRIRGSQSKFIPQAMGVKDPEIVMWSVLSGDFDTSRSGESCFQVVKKYAFPGAIVVFHDSPKAFPNLARALPQTLRHFSSQGYRFEKIPVK